MTRFYPICIQSASYMERGQELYEKGIQHCEYLRRQKHVKSYRLGEFGEGDAGVTIVELK